MKLRSGKVIGDKPVLSLEIKKLIEDDLEQLKEGVPDQLTYDHIVTALLAIHTKHLSSAAVISSLEKEIECLGDDGDGELWGCVYMLSTLMDGSNNTLAFNYYDDDFKNNEELKIKVAGEIYDFINDNN